MRTKIKNAWILTCNEKMEEFIDGEIIFEEDKIVYVGNRSDEAADVVIDGEGGIVLPGMVNTHCHASMIPFRSLGDDCPDRLRRFLIPLENEAMNEELAKISLKYAIGEMLQSGITCFADMYYYVDKLAEVCIETGIRALLGETVYYAPTCDADEAYGGLELGRRYMEEHKNHPLVTLTLAPHATNTNEGFIFQQAMEIVKKNDTILMTHASEMDYEMTYFQETYQLTPIEWLDSLGCLNENILLAHCILTDEKDLDLIAARKAGISHCISSNMKAGKGIAPLKEMVKRKIPVGLGTDGPSSGNTLELFSSMRLVAQSQKTKYHDRALFPAKEIVRLATIEGARSLKMEKKIGSLEAGKQADLVLVSTQAPNMFPIYDPYSALVYSACSHDVKEVFVAGKHLVKEYETIMDMKRIREELTDAMSDFRRIAKEREQAL